MQKYGKVTVKSSNTEYYLAFYTDNTGFERLDIFDNFETYNHIDTTTCIASYYKKQVQRMYGDEELLKLVLKTVRDASTFKGESATSTSTENGVIEVIQSNENKSIGMKCYTHFKMGNIESQYYETPEAEVYYDEIDYKVNNTVAPININLYNTYSIAKDSMVANTSSDYYSAEYLKSTYKLDHLDKYRCVVVDSMVTAIAELELWKNAPTKVKAIDLETTGLEWTMFGKDVITGIVLSFDENQGTYFPFRQEAFDYNLPISFIQEMLDVINSQPEDVLIIGHNAKVEMQGIWKEDVNYIKYSEYALNWNANWEEEALQDPQLRIDGDSMLLSILCNPVFKRGTHALKSLAYKIRGEYFLELSDIFKNKSVVKFNVLPKELVELYACMDTANTICVWNHLIKQLPQDEMGILALEAQMIPITAANEFYGMRIKQDLLSRSLENMEYLVKTLGDLFKGIHRINSNINSPDVRRDIFYNVLRCPVEVRTRTGKASTSNEALRRLVEVGTLREYDETKPAKDIKDLFGSVVVKGKELISNRFPSLVILDKYAKAMKELGAFRRIERKSKHGRVYFSLNQAGAATGRATSDAHQYSDGMKKLIVADSEDHFLWSADFKQIELRILAYLAGQEDLIELQKNPDIDIHRAVLSIITKKPIWAISAAERKKGKSTNFGVVYMMSAFGLAKKQAGPAYTNDDYIECLQSINGFYNGLPKIKRFVHDNEVFVRERGYMRTKFGRRRYFKEILDPSIDKSSVSSMVRAANNFPVQGFGADYLKIVECKINQYIKDKGWDKKVEVDGVVLPLVRIMLPIHDEVLVSSHKSIPHEEIITMFKTCMEIKINNAPPFFSAPAMVGCWYDGKLDQYEIDLSFRDEIVKAWDKNKTRLLHSESYCDEFDYLMIKDVKRYCSHLRKTYLKDRALKELTDTELLNIANSIEPANLERLKKHCISSEEILQNEDEYKVVAIKKALDENFSPYLEDLSRYRARRLQDYMDDLIRKYKTVDAVAEHVTHPELTHTLISLKINKDDKLEHNESIRVAVERYMDEIQESGRLNIDAYGEKELDADLSDSVQTFADLEEFVEFDQNGEVILQEASSEWEEEDSEDIYEVERPVTKSYCICTLSEMIVDLSDFSKEKAEEINVAIAKLSSKKGYYRILYMRKGELRATPYTVECSSEDLNAIITSIIEEVPV